MNQIGIVIPTLEPDNKFIHLLKELRSREKQDIPIIVIDDGSGSEYKDYFDRAEIEFHCILLQENVNRGKGRAIKTAIQYVLENLPQVDGLVTIDSDGQHTYDDMKKCIAIFENNTQSLILGSRDFTNKIPFRSKLGNIITRNVLKLTTGISLIDTQTGLRVIPRSFMKSLLDTPGERFEFEMNMLLATKKEKTSIIEVNISTIYIEENKSSHFHFLHDSFSIYAVFIRYFLSSIFSFLIDVSLFSIILSFFKDINFQTITISSYSARFISSLFNYYINKVFVFKNDASNLRYSFLKYYGLVMIQIFSSSLMVTLSHQYFPITSPTVLKIAIDLLLFLISFYIQKKWVFKR